MDLDGALDGYTPMRKQSTMLRHVPEKWYRRPIVCPVTTWCQRGRADCRLEAIGELGTPTAVDQPVV